MKILAALLAEVLLWRRVVVKNADTAAVLPDLADVALDEDARSFFSSVGRCRRAVLLGLLLELGLNGGGQARIFGLAAHTARDFLLLLLLLLLLFFSACGRNCDQQGRVESALEGAG